LVPVANSANETANVTNSPENWPQAEFSGELGC
jgi:hypothetical protein